MYFKIVYNKAVKKDLANKGKEKAKMNRIVLGVDEGNYNIKTKEYIFPSGIIKHGQINPDRDKQLYYKENYYTLSEGHGVIDRKKIKDERYQILMLFAIAKELVHREIQTSYKNEDGDSIAKEIEIALGLGVPPGHSNRAFKQEKIDYYKQKDAYEFIYDDLPYKIKIVDVKVFAQGWAALVSNQDYIQNEKASLKKYFVLDIGGGTIEFLQVKNSVLSNEKCYSLPDGTIDIANEIIKKISAQYSLNIEEDDVFEAIDQPEISLLEDNIKAIIEETFKDRALAIIKKAVELQLDPKITPLFLVGGGTKYFVKYFTPENGVKYLIYEKDIRANARGYELFAEILSE